MPSPVRGAVLTVRFLCELGSLFYLGGRIDAIGARIDGLASRLDAHLDRHAG
jgi:hypothetical protein